MKRTIIIIASVSLLAIVANFSQSIYNLWHKRDLLSQAQNELKLAQKEHAQLQKQLAIVRSKQFVEEQARDKLFMVKPGESSVIIPQTLLPTSSPLKKGEEAKKPNWQQWSSLFFH